MQFWDRIYTGEKLHYGMEPNSFVAETVEELLTSKRLKPGARVIDVATGEGRNALYLGRSGFEVTALDSSSVGLGKARRRAEQEGVEISFLQEDFLSWKSDEPFDLVVTTFLHLPPEMMETLYQSLAELTLPGGYLLAEWFHPDQRLNGYTSGGPPEARMMVRPEHLRGSLKGWDLLINRRRERELREGNGHLGPAVVTQLLAVSPRL